MNTIANYLYSGCTARKIGHTELWFGKPGRPADSSRNPGYNQQSPTDAAAHCDRLKKLGIDVLMFNTYAIGSWENHALEIYLPITTQKKLNVIINIDKGIYRGKPSPITEIRNYLLYLRKVAFVLSNYEKWNGKYIVTYFAMPGDDPAMFAQIEKENQDCVFVYNGANFGKSQMSWIHSTLEVGLDQWCAHYSNLKDAGLYIPHVAPGFNDTFQGHSVWSVNSPPRVYPPSIGPNADTLKRHFDVINKYYNTANQLQYLQLVTVNDWDELTSIEPKADGSGGFFAPVPIVTVRGEIWVDGQKFGDLTPGNHTMTLVRVMSDGTLEKTQIQLVV